VFPLANGAHSAASAVLELLAWVSAVAARVPGRLGVIAGEVRQTAVEWGLPVREVSDLYAAFPGRLALAVGAVALVCAVVALVHALRERRDDASPDARASRVIGR
jgi:hypothetical protein